MTQVAANSSRIKIIHNQSRLTFAVADERSLPIAKILSRVGVLHIISSRRRRRRCHN